MKRMLVLSGKGGTGKTTLSAAMIRFSKAEAFADCDVDAPNLHLVTADLGEPEKSDFMGSDKAWIDPEKCTGCGICMEHCRFGAIESLDGGVRVKEQACEGCGVCEAVCPVQAAALRPDIAGRLELYRGNRVFSTARLKMGRGNSGKLVNAVKLGLWKAAPEGRLAVIDGSPGIGCPVIASVSGVDLVLIVAEPSLSGRSDLERLLKTIETFQTKAAVCVNKWDVCPEQTEEIERFCQEHSIPFAGRIPYDREALKAANSGVSVAELDCPAREALYEVYQNVMKELFE